MTIEFAYFDEITSLLQIMALGFVLSLPACFAVESFKSTGIKAGWFYLALSMVISAVFGIGFAFAFTDMNISEALWLAVCLWLGTQGFYEYLQKSEGFIGKLFVSLTERFGLGENKQPAEEPTVSEPTVPEIIPSLPAAEDRNTEKAQIKVLVSNLRVRTAPGGEVLGFAEKGGFYTYTSTQIIDGITWYNLGNAYIGDDGEGDIRAFAVGEEDKEYLIYPVNYVGIAGGFTKDHPAIDFGYSSEHGGKNQAVIAPSDMEVISVGESGTIGKYIRSYATVNGEKLTYRFIHLASVNVSKGDKIRKGEKIGRMGNTGSSSNGYHLHFDIWKGHTSDLAGSSSRYEKSVNPLDVCHLADGQIVGDETDRKYTILRAEA